MPRASRWLLKSDRVLDLTEPRLMGVVNLTPDSFHAASRALDAAPGTVQRVASEGASIIDVGAESTRPGADRVPWDEQVRRLSALDLGSRADATRPVPICVDTTLAPVARAMAPRIDAINDVSAGLEDPDMLPLAANLGCGLVLMHRALPPGQDSFSDRYPSTSATPMTGDVVEQVCQFLLQRAQAAINAGVLPERIALDPGFGFGKTVEQNMDLVRHIAQIVDLGYPVIAGVSRKSFVGRVGDPSSDTTPDQRLPATLAIALALIERGVQILRVHDVAAHAQAIRAWQAAR